MVSGRGRDAPGHGASGGWPANEEGLRALGEQINGGGTAGSVANEDGLRALGEEMDRALGIADGHGGGGRGRNGSSGNRFADDGHHPDDRSSYGNTRVAPPPRPPVTPPPLGKPRRKRWSTRRKVVTGLVSFVVLVLLAVAGGYAYLRYQWSQVKTLQCPTCVAAADGAPFNVLLVGSDTRAGDTGQAAQSFGSSALVPGQRSDTIKILHVDPKTGTARLLSIPRDTYVTMSGLPESTGLTGDQKINTAYNDGPNPLIKTIENTFGIPISHFVIVDFSGVINTVDTLGGINLNFNYPVRDNDNGNNNSGLNVTKTGCQTINGNTALALARSRYYQYYANGQWNDDPTSDIGRITRQNAIIEAIAAKAKGTYNPIALNSFIGTMVHNIEVDQNMSFGDMYALAERYHAFSPSGLQTYTLPTNAEQTSGGEDVQVVSQPAAQQTIEAFLGGSPKAVSTPPIDGYGDPVYASSSSSSSSVRRPRRPRRRPPRAAPGRPRSRRRRSPSPPSSPTTPLPADLRCGAARPGDRPPASPPTAPPGPLRPSSRRGPASSRRRSSGSPRRRGSPRSAAIGPPARIRTRPS